MSKDSGKPRKNATVRRGISDWLELRNLLYAISEEFPMVISVNLTKNSYKMLEYKNYSTKKADAGGLFDDLISVGASTIDPVHRQEFIDTFSRQSLLRAYASGQKRVELDTRQLKDNGEYGWVKTIVIFLTNPENEDVLEITLAQPIEDEKKKELENIHLRTVMEIALLSNYEYISIINSKTGWYELQSHINSNTHRIPPKGDYNKSTMMIRDTLVDVTEREDFFKNTKLSNVIARIKDGNGHFSCRYRLNDTPERRWREGTFHICLPDADEILHTVRDVHNEVMAEQAKRMQEILRRNMERQQLLIGLGFDVLVDIDLVSLTAEVLGEANKLLNREIKCDNFPWGEIDAGMVHPDDLETVMDTIRLAAGVESFSVDFRYKHGDGYFFWCRCKAVMLRDEAGKPYRCILKLTDIEDQKRSEQKLLYKAQRDSLTGLYNSMTTEMLIDDLLSVEGKDHRHGLMVIDADDFKHVNDRWGHKAGDMVLQSFADMLTSSFRSTDIVGRVGGDEFVVFLKNADSPQAVLESAHKFLKRITPVQVSESGETYTPGCSIGVGMYPDNGTTYASIFRLADKAMYTVKDSGKNSAMLYDGSSEPMD